ncbi:hypothetical protein KGY77_10215 [Candidatus Bipolaricaulota bacterium]|nr:hypothetical protein [Candidatus Bipolaricaulota bacterium]
MKKEEKKKKIGELLNEELLGKEGAELSAWVKIYAKILKKRGEQEEKTGSLERE